MKKCSTCNCVQFKCKVIGIDTARNIPPEHTAVQNSLSCVPLFLCPVLFTLFSLQQRTTIKAMKAATLQKAIRAEKNLSPGGVFMAQRGDM